MTSESTMSADRRNKIVEIIKKIMTAEQGAQRPVTTEQFATEIIRRDPSAKDRGQQWSHWVAEIEQLLVDLGLFNGQKSIAGAAFSLDAPARARMDMAFSFAERQVNSKAFQARNRKNVDEFLKNTGGKFGLTIETDPPETPLEQAQRKRTAAEHFNKKTAAMYTKKQIQEMLALDKRLERCMAKEKLRRPSHIEMFEKYISDLERELGIVPPTGQQ